ncbi:hypothetical protein AOLI_G00160430 [Acnodon oligacanthus]
MEPVNSQNPNPDDVVDTELEEGDVPISSTLARDEGTEQVHVSRREHKPIIRLTYDEPGKPSDRHAKEIGTGGERKRECELSGFNPAVSQLVRV